MKRILFPLAALAFLAACNTTPQYTIKGSIEGENEGTVYLLKYNRRVVDTLNQAPIKSGKFTMRGIANNLTNAELVVEGKKGGAPILIENATFTATLHPTDNTLSKIEGTENQKILNEYLAISYDYRKQQSELYKEYSAAMQAKDEKTINAIRNQFNEADSLFSAKKDALIAAYPDSYVAPYIINSQIYNLDLPTLQEKYNALGENAKASEYGQKIAEHIKKLETVAIGQKAPNFTQDTPEGKPLSLYDIKGKVKIIDFWASWCGPCRRANPEMVRIYKKFHPKGLEILGVSLDRDKANWEKAIADDHLVWYQVSDLQYWNNAAAGQYAVMSIPNLFILNEDNIIVAHNLHGQELEDKIAELLK
ncbi:TlpA disulfide reductase family protein [Odoribacter lunatus]|uniref:TlpA disulfide reductase family protein n=1 Tax=Odoribacter lunatus TaxID=2941335 RepID=UPI00203BEDBE|nr:TlpA disulfide reductase family protein [Odoribacter lunatus]